MEIFNLELADVVFKIKTNYKFAKHFCREYLTDKQHEFCISISQEDIAKEMQATKGEFLPEQVETTCVYRAIAELLPLKNKIVFHSVALYYNNSAYLFIAPSGTGKTTHAMLWQKYLPTAKIINGDKPILDFNNGLKVYSSPWAGKENFGYKTCQKVEAICLINQSKQNTITKQDMQNYLLNVINQVYMPKDKQALNLTLDILNKLCDVDFFKLDCDISKQAFITCYQALTNLTYKE